MQEPFGEARPGTALKLSANALQKVYVWQNYPRAPRRSNSFNFVIQHHVYAIRSHWQITNFLRTLCRNPVTKLGFYVSWSECRQQLPYPFVPFFAKNAQRHFPIGSRIFEHTDLAAFSALPQIPDSQECCHIASLPQWMPCFSCP